jgi:hypothetical protein
MSAHGPLRPIAALQFFGRNWGHSGHRDALEPEGSVAIDPKRHFDTAGSLQTFRSTRLPSVCGRLVSACTSWLSTAQSGKRRKHSSMSITEARGPAARLALVEEHVRLENRHDLDHDELVIGYDLHCWRLIISYHPTKVQSAKRCNPKASSAPADRFAAL